MSETIIRPPTIREVYERIQDRIKECEEREKLTARKTSEGLTEMHEHPDMHFWRLLEMIFRPVEETPVNLGQQLGEFFRLQSKKNEEKQGKPGETDKGVD